MPATFCDRRRRAKQVERRSRRFPGHLKEVIRSPWADARETGEQRRKLDTNSRQLYRWPALRVLASTKHYRRDRIGRSVRCKTGSPAGAEQLQWPRSLQQLAIAIFCVAATPRWRNKPTGEKRRRRSEF